jgi:histidinol dehydrogenase
MIRILPSDRVGRLLARRKARFTEAEETVRPILEAVRKRGDKALVEYAQRFDNLERKSVRVPAREIEKACGRLSPEFREAVETAAANIRAFAEMQMPVEHVVEVQSGMQLGQVVRPLDTVAAYIPGGRYPLPSTVLMTVVPAQVAGAESEGGDGLRTAHLENVGHL